MSTPCMHHATPTNNITVTVSVDGSSSCTDTSSFICDSMKPSIQYLLGDRFDPELDKLIERLEATPGQTATTFPLKCNAIGYEFSLYLDITVARTIDGNALDDLVNKVFSQQLSEDFSVLVNGLQLEGSLPQLASAN